MSIEHATRNTERTRRAILDAARTALREKGAGVAIGTIAELAGVTKGGLLHHFPNRDALLLSVARDAVEQFRAQVFARVDRSENHPGKLLRAYIRTLFEGDDEADSFEYPGLWGALSAVPDVAELLQEDAEYWRSGFGEDGLHADRILFARHAAEGVALSLQWGGGLTAADAADVLTKILALTDGDGPIEDGT